MQVGQQMRGAMGRAARPLRALLELGLIVLWSAWVGRGFLNLDSRVLPQGREFGLAIFSHFTWANLWRCGACAWWNGLVNGGNPAFVDLHGAVLHPVVIAS